ncbi:MAG: DUF86 domain-containing protein [Methanoregula sp.]|nr:DUF86 domain-containing protein [Methanoregula sp.]
MIPEDLAYLHHICDAITHIEDFSKNISSAAELTDSVLERAGVERMLITIGEAAKNLSPQLRREYPHIPWRETTGTRDKIVHHYFGVDYDSVFETIKIDLPELKQQIEAILVTSTRTPTADENKRKNQKPSEKRG